MRQRARSAADKAKRSEDLLDAAEALTLELGGARFVTVAAVTERAGLHRTGARRYYGRKEDLLLELAERGWRQWRDAVAVTAAGRSDVDPRETARVMSHTLVQTPILCDLATQVPLNLEGEVNIESARRYKTNSFEAHDEIVSILSAIGVMTEPQIVDLISAAIPMAGWYWQLSHPTPSLAALYAEVPEWGHSALNFEPRLTLLLEATAVGLYVGDRSPTP